MREAHIAGYGTALPWRVSTPRFIEVDAEARQVLGQGEGTRSMVRQFALASGIRFRYTASPCWLPEDERPGDVEDIFTPFDFDPPEWVRARFFNEQAPKMVIDAARQAIAQWGGSLADITHVVTTCTTGWAMPSISTILVQSLGLSLETQKMELNFSGCFSGATCLRAARDIIRAGDAPAVLVVAAEISSVHYKPAAEDTATLVGSSLFSDGAAAFIVAPAGGWSYLASGMSLVPETDHTLATPESERTLNPAFSYRNTGPLIAAYLRGARGAGLLQMLLRMCDGQPPALVVHAGGPGIMDAIKDVFAEAGWPPEAILPSVEMSYDIGQLAAAMLPVILARMLPEVSGARVATLAFGPGVTAEWALLERR